MRIRVKVRGRAGLPNVLDWAGLPKCVEVSLKPTCTLKKEFQFDGLNRTNGSRFVTRFLCLFSERSSVLLSQ